MSPSPATTVPNAGSPFQLSGNLYLFTFLTAIVVLLCVSICIGARLVLVRSRQRRSFRDTGLSISPTHGRDELSTRPVLHEVYLGGGLDNTHLSDTVREHSWSFITPVSVTLPSDDHLPFAKKDLAFHSSQLRLSHSSSPLWSLSSLPPSRRTASRQRGTVSDISTRAQVDAQTLSQSPTSRSEPFTPSIPETIVSSPNHSSISSIRVAVVVVMPSPTPLHSLKSPAHENYSEHSHQLPHLEFGISEVGRVPKSGQEVRLEAGDDETMSPNVLHS